MKKLLIFFVLLSSISSFGQVQRPKTNPATLNWLLPFSITKQAYHATDSAVYSSPNGVIYKAPIQVGEAFDTTTYQATHHTWSKSNIFVNDTVGNSYPVMKRDTAPTENGLFLWENNSKRAVTSSKFTFTPSSSYFLQSYLTNGKFERGFTTVTGKPYFNYTDNSNNNCLALDSTNNLTIGNATNNGQFTLTGTGTYNSTFNQTGSTLTITNSYSSGVIYINHGTSVNTYIVKPNEFVMYANNTAKSIYARDQITNFDGVNLTLYAGGTYTSRSNGNGGTLYLRGGTTNNAGYSSVRLQRFLRTSTSGITANTARDAFVVPSDKPLSNNTETTLFTIPFPADSATYGNSVSGKIYYAISVRGTDGVQSMSGVITFAGVEYLGTVTTNIAADISRTALSSSTLTLTPTLTYAAGVWTVKVNSNSGLTTPVTKFTYSVELGNNGASITQN